MRRLIVLLMVLALLPVMAQAQDFIRYYPSSVPATGGTFTGAIVIAATPGSELVSNGTFETNMAGWAGVNWTWSAGAAAHAAGTATDNLTQAGLAATVGAQYRVTYTIVTTNGYNVRSYFGGVYGSARTSTGTFVEYVTAASTEAFSIVQDGFIGTIDNVSVVALTGGSLTVDGDMDLRGTLTLHTGIELPEGMPIRLGYLAMPVSTSGTYNVPGSNIAIGDHAGNATTTGQITAVGYYAGWKNVDGVLTAFGRWAGYSNTSGHATFFGNGAGRSNTTANASAFGDETCAFSTTVPCTGFGYYAANKMTSGTTTAMGYQAGRDNETGAVAAFGSYAAYLATGSTSAFGERSGEAATTGTHTAIGYGTGIKATTGSLTLLGHKAGWGATYANAPIADTFGILIGHEANRSVVSATTLSNYIGIGYGTLIDKSNQVKVGNATIAETVLYGNLILKDTGARPTCDSTTRGSFWYEEAAAGVADTFELCRKDAANAYAWVSIF